MKTVTPMWTSTAQDYTLTGASGTFGCLVVKQCTGKLWGITAFGFAFPMRYVYSLDARLAANRLAALARQCESYDELVTLMAREGAYVA